jgi:hypothetical protein
MSHWAELNANNKVIRVLVGDNNDPNGDEGYQYNYAGIGYTYDADADAFIAPRPECGHTELFLNDNFKWNCQRCELDAKQL